MPMLDPCRISSSQDELLQLHHHDALPLSAAAIVMVSPPETQDVFHTPPEGSSLPTSSDDRCAVNNAVDVDGGTEVFVDLCGYSDDGAEFVDLGRDSDLGLLEPQLTQVIDPESVAECSRGFQGDYFGEDPTCQFPEFGVSERGLCELGELPVEKFKLSEQNLGYDSLWDCFGVELQKAEEGMENCKGKLVDLQPEEIVLDGGNCCRTQTETVEENMQSDEVVEGSEMQKRNDGEPKLRVLPDSIRGCLDNAAKGFDSGNGKGRKKGKCPVFDVLRVLSENTEEVENSVDSLCWLKAAKLRGLSFPSPCWWPDNDNFKKG